MVSCISACLSLHLVCQRRWNQRCDGLRFPFYFHRCKAFLLHWITYALRLLSISFILFVFYHIHIHTHTHMTETVTHKSDILWHVAEGLVNAQKFPISLTWYELTWAYYAQHKTDKANRKYRTNSAKQKKKKNNRIG